VSAQPVVELSDRLALVLADACDLGQRALASRGARQERHEDGVDEEHDGRGHGQPVGPAVRQCRQLTHVEVGAKHGRRDHDQRTWIHNNIVAAT